MMIVDQLIPVVVVVVVVVVGIVQLFFSIMCILEITSWPSYWKNVEKNQEFNSLQPSSDATCFASAIVL